MRFDGNDGGHVNYEPNSYNGPVENKQFNEPPLRINGAADRYDHRKDNDDFTQAGDLYRLMSAAQKTILIDNIVGAMKAVPRAIQERQVKQFTAADPDYGARVAKGLGL
ncbi:MAG: catalase-related domain-containing protein, partial [Gammaproteobacteria bacterium]